MNKDKKLVSTINFKDQSDGNRQYYYHLIDGITKDTAMDIENKFDKMMSDYGIENDGDYIDLVLSDAIESIFDSMGIRWETPNADYVIDM